MWKIALPCLDNSFMTPERQMNIRQPKTRYMLPRGAGLTLKLRKCVLVTKHITTSGHTGCSRGIEALIQTMQTIWKLECPTIMVDYGFILGVGIVFLSFVSNFTSNVTLLKMKLPKYELLKFYEPTNDEMAAQQMLEKKLRYLLYSFSHVCQTATPWTRKFSICRSNMPFCKNISTNQTQNRLFIRLTYRSQSRLQFYCFREFCCNAGNFAALSLLEVSSVSRLDLQRWNELHADLSRFHWKAKKLSTIVLQGWTWPYSKRCY